MINYLITGATSHLGKALAKYFAQNGQNKILLVSRTIHDFSSLESLGNVKYLSNIDLLKSKDLEILSNTCNEYFNDRVNIINCVGYYKGQKPFEETTLEDDRNIFESNFIAVYNTAKALIPYLKLNGGGHFISFSCNSVRYRYPYMAPFSASKAAIDCLMGSLANEFSKFGIIANSFSLATIDTDYERIVKPFGDHKNWLKLEEVALIINDVVNGNFNLMNGNNIDLFKYSESFFCKSYFERIKK